MKKYHLYFASLLLFFCLLVGCSENQPSGDVPDAPVAVSLTAGIGNVTLTRATDGKWEAGDAVGLCMNAAGSTEPANAVFNYRYVIASAGAGGKLQPDGEANTAYFPADGSKVDFLAYYPYAGDKLTEEFRLPVDVSQQPAVDVLTARADGHDRNTPSVALSFSHRLVKLIFVLKGSDTVEPAQLAGATLILKGMNTKATCLLTDGSISAASTPRDISVPLNAAGTAGEAIVLPRSAAPGVSFVVTLTDGKEYTATMSETQNLAAGTQNTFTLTLRVVTKPEEPVEAVVEATIEPWTDGINTSADASVVEVKTPDTPPAGSGTGSANSGFEPGDAFTLWAQRIEGAGYAFTLGDDNRWSSTPVLYWDVLKDEQTAFYALHTPPGTPSGNRMPDLLAATTTTGRLSPVSLTFRHLAAQLNVVLKAGAGMTQAEVETALASLPQAIADYTLDGITLAPGSARKEITLSGTGDKRNALIVPQTIAAGENLLTLTIGGQPYYLKSTDRNGVFEGGKSYTLTVTVSRTEASMSVSIGEWQDGGSSDGDAGMEI
ncbi:fimbrillin family protein [Bacteroides timonensis]|uniref:fimbrillin family protein n=1 Tax=Bacteroides timonensis TaxID=1470345 RepID=UPI0004B9E33A|nr:fimbrillin family protein [Bacteroides timonensis]